MVKSNGDGALVSFKTISDAVYWAGDLQQAILENDVQLKFDLHQGEITIEEGDIFGDGVNAASRIEAITTVGGLWVSDSVQRIIQDKNEISINIVIEEILKYVKQAVRIYK